MTKKTFTIDRFELLMVVRRLTQVSPSRYNSVVMIESQNGDLILSAFDDGLTVIEILPKKNVDIGEQVVVDLRKLYVFLSNTQGSDVTITITDKSVVLKSGESRAVIARTTVIRRESIPSEDARIGVISRTSLDDLTRVANISADKDSPRPLLNGVMFTVSDGDIRTISTNGMAIGYAWELNKAITVKKKERILIPATAVSSVQKYDWQGEDRISVYRHGSSVCFSNGLSYIFVTEFAEKENYPDAQLMAGMMESKSRYYFKLGLESFRSAIDAASSLAEYKDKDDKSLSVTLANGKLFVMSGKETPDEVEARGQEFRGYFTTMIPSSYGDDFEFCLSSALAKIALALLAQVDKGGMLRVSLGEVNRMVYFAADTVDAVYAVLQIYR